MRVILDWDVELLAEKGKVEVCELNSVKNVLT
jgi:hypothetical protein